MIEMSLKTDKASSVVLWDRNDCTIDIEKLSHKKSI